MAKQALGKGLGALIKKSAGTDSAPTKAEESAAGGKEVRQAPIETVIPSPLQPRSSIPEGDLDELLESIRQHGVIQPLIVRRVDGKLELIAGERRWRACAKLGLETVPVIEREATDREVLEMALVENLQRQDLNPIEESAGYVRLSSEFGLKQDEIATRVGKSRASVANSMRLLDLHKDIQGFVAKGLVTVGHAKAILGIKVKREQREIAEQVMRGKLTVRATEKLVQERHADAPQKKSAKGTRKLDPETEAMIHSLSNRLREKFATHVSISHTEKKGRIELDYYGSDDLGRLLELMGVNLRDL